MDADGIIAFERDIADRFNRGEIKAPIHLDGGNERQLVEIFKSINRDDWIAGTWRLHAKCLLHGVPPDRLREDIIAGKSITLCYPEHRIVSSAIVGGIIPMAMGIAWWIKRTGGTNRVHCFVGDMCAETGAFDECVKYAHWNDLPIRWIVEDNDKSVCTNTTAAWGKRIMAYSAPVIRYSYELPWPHAGAGKRVQF